MTIQNQQKLAKHIFRLLKVNEIVFSIGRTNKGNLGIKFNQANDDYEIYLDAVPLSTKDMLADDNNIELKKMIDKYLFDTIPYQPPYVPMTTSSVTSSTPPVEPPKKRGRPSKKK